MKRKASPRRPSRIASRVGSFTLVSLALAACGDNADESVPAEILPASTYAARCVAPRSGIDPATGRAYLDTEGSVLDEQLWLRSWIDDLYLWYNEVPRQDPRMFKDAVEYFAVLKTPLKTASGNNKDNFHFPLDTAAWVAMSQGGVEAGYGVQWAFPGGKTRPPRELVVAYTQPGSPAAAVNPPLERGAKIIKIDGVDVEFGSDVDTLNNGLFPAALNEKHTFEVLDLGAATTRSVTLTSTTVDLVPVQNAHTLPAPNDKVGYLLFTDHIATAEKGLVEAIGQLRTAGVTDLILDIRYNGGGYLAIAAQLAYMIAGPTATAGKFFERLSFNDKYTTVDPYTGRPLVPEEFVDQTLGFSLAPGQPLPYLGLSRVFVLTSAGTCSASESVMNGLAGAGVEVIQIGETTCGKPYGFVPEDNCGTTFFAIQFQGVNYQGFGDYADGFIPGGMLHGCDQVADDFTHALGDPAEDLLAAALGFRANETCPATTQARSRDPLSAAEAVIPKPVWRQNRILGR